MPFYDFKCDECGKLVEDEFFKIVDDKYIECCGKRMEQVILSAPGLSDPGGIGHKWTNDGYQMTDPGGSGTLRTVTKKFKKGKQVI
jgi:putative FmdB family regulatory protein